MAKEIIAAGKTNIVNNKKSIDVFRAHHGRVAKFILMPSTLEIFFQVPPQYFSIREEGSP